MTQEATPSPAPEAAASSNIETAEQRKERLLAFANEMKELTPEELALIAQQHPQRNIPHIILMIGCNIGSLELVEWACQNHPDVVNLSASPDTLSILQVMGIIYPSM